MGGQECVDDPAFLAPLIAYAGEVIRRPLGDPRDSCQTARWHCRGVPRSPADAWHVRGATSLIRRAPSCCSPGDPRAHSHGHASISSRGSRAQQQLDHLSDDASTSAGSLCRGPFV